MKQNIEFKTPAIAEYYSRSRVRWADFYSSERRIIEGLKLRPHHTVLDIGCGCGGLGLALRDEFGIEDYTGVEIARSAADAAEALRPGGRILCGDILDLSGGPLRNELFDAVFSLGCVDWNVRSDEMLSAAWGHVRPGGHLISTFRMTTGEGCDDFSRSYQFINFEGKREGELAPYVVLNSKALIARLSRLKPCRLEAYGYWGVPSATAVTPYDRLCFAALSVSKCDDTNSCAGIRYDLDLPSEISEAIGILPALRPQDG